MVKTLRIMTRNLKNFPNDHKNSQAIRATVHLYKQAF